MRQLLNTLGSNWPTVLTPDDLSVEHGWNCKCQGKNRVLREEPAPLTICTLQIPHALPLTSNHASVVWSQQLILDLYVLQPEKPPLLCDMCKSIRGIMVVTACSTAPWNSSLLQVWCTATCPLTMPHKELPGTVKSGLCGVCDDDKNHGQSSSSENVVKHHLQWGWNVKGLHHFKTTHLL